MYNWCLPLISNRMHLMFYSVDNNYLLLVACIYGSLAFLILGFCCSLVNDILILKTCYLEFFREFAIFGS